MSAFTDKAKAVISAVAPTLGTALGGPFGAMAGVLIAKALGVEAVGADAEAAVNAALATGNPDILLKLKEAENDFVIRLEELGISRDKLAYDDRANARAREIAVKDKTPQYLAFGIIGGFLGISLLQLIALMGWAEHVRQIPSEGWLLIGNISGYLANEAKQAAAYYFGSSPGQVQSDKVIQEIAKMP